MPMVFLAGYVFIIISMFWAAPKECLMGLSLIAVGLPFYWMTTRPEPGEA